MGAVIDCRSRSRACSRSLLMLDFENGAASFSENPAVVEVGFIMLVPRAHHPSALLRGDLVSPPAVKIVKIVTTTTGLSVIICCYQCSYCIPRVARKRGLRIFLSSFTKCFPKAIRKTQELLEEPLRLSWGNEESYDEPSRSTYKNLHKRLSRALGGAFQELLKKPPRSLWNWHWENLEKSSQKCRFNVLEKNVEAIRYAFWNFYKSFSGAFVIDSNKRLEEPSRSYWEGRP